MDKELNRTNKAIDEGFDLTTPFEDINLQDYDAVITGLQEELGAVNFLLVGERNAVREVSDMLVIEHDKATNLQNSHTELKAALLEAADLLESQPSYIGSRPDKYRAIANKELDYE